MEAGAVRDGMAPVGEVERALCIYHEVHRHRLERDRVAAESRVSRVRDASMDKSVVSRLKRMIRYIDPRIDVSPAGPDEAFWDVAHRAQRRVGEMRRVGEERESWRQAEAIFGWLMFAAIMLWAITVLTIGRWIWGLL